MKKIAINVLIYTFIASLICFIIGMFAFKLPILNANDIWAYRANNGWLFVLELLPSAVITGFLIGCSIYFGTLDVPHARFSAVLSENFKPIIALCIVFTFALSLSHDILTPSLKQKKTFFEQKPAVIVNYMNLANEYQSKCYNNPQYAVLALYYTRKVLELDPKNEQAKELARKAELAASVKVNKQKGAKKSSTKKSTGPVEQIDTVEIQKIKGSTTYELVTQSQKYFDEEKYLDAHYYAHFAVKFAEENDVNLAKAKELENKAWNILSQAKAEKLTEANRFFRKKLEGYTKFINEDYLGSYYIFQSLAIEKEKYEKDPDVKRYLAEARTNVEKEYFFTDETADTDAFETTQNVYFSLPHSDGTYDIIYAGGIIDIEGAGKYVRYLRDVYIYSFDSMGNFKSVMSVENAKMLATDSTMLSKEKRIELGIDDKWKTVPYVMLCSVDRDIEGQKISPEYFDKNNNKIEGPNQIFLSMPYGDFDVLAQCADGNNTVNFWTMAKMKVNAKAYGFSREIILQSVMTSVFYPFMIFIVLLFCASIGWNYRLLTENLFKFVWVFVIPLFHYVLYGVIGFFEFLIKLLNFIFVGIGGANFALLLGIVFYALWIVAMSFLFLSRKGD